MHFSSVTRKDVDACARVAELARWWPRVLDVASRNRGDDPGLGLDWQVSQPVLSTRDIVAPALAELMQTLDAFDFASENDAR